MTTHPTPRADALRAMREAKYARQQEAARLRRVTKPPDAKVVTAVAKRAVKRKGK